MRAVAKGSRRLGGLDPEWEQEPFRFDHQFKKLRAIAPKRLPPAIESLVWTVDRRHIPPAKTGAIEEHYAAQHTAVINPVLAIALQEKNGCDRFICSSHQRYRSFIRGFLAKPEPERDPARP